MSDKHTSAEAEALADMEGFYEKGKGQGLLFFQLFDGSICLKSREVPTEEGWEVEPIETKNPRTKALVYTYVKRFDKLIVRVGDVNKRQKEFDEGGKVTNWNFTVLAGKKRAILQTVWMDALLQKFLKVAPNIDFTKPILFGAFTKVEKGKKKQLIRIAQGGSSPTSDDWVAVPWYWEKKKDENGKVRLDTKAKGPDGTVLPDPIHDEEDDEWDFKPQNKFLAKHFVENTLPKIKKIADELGLSHKMVVDDEDEAGKSADFPTHSGPQIPVVTKRPKNPESESVSDAMTPGQASELRKLAKQIGKEVEAVSQKFLEIGFDELSIEGAAYLKYKMEKRIAKAREEDPDAYPEPVEKKKKKPAPPVEDDDDDDDDDEPAPKKSSKKSDDDDDDDEWGAAEAPKSSQKKKKPKSDDDDEDEDWGEHDDNVLRDEDGNVIF